MPIADLLAKVKTDRRQVRPTSPTRAGEIGGNLWHYWNRVATLVSANLNDLIDRAEDPENMHKQVIPDMENQFIQVKTQVAMAMADQHLLQKKSLSTRTRPTSGCAKRSWRWTRSEDDLARVALENSSAEPRGDQRKQRQREVRDALKNTQWARVQPHDVLQHQCGTDRPERNEGECGVGGAGADTDHISRDCSVGLEAHTVLAQ